MVVKNIDRSIIVEIALKMLNELGLESLSLRKVAAQLDVKAPSLYWYITDKDDLLAAMGEKLLKDCLISLPPCDNWQSWLFMFGKSLLNTQMCIRDSNTLLMSVRSTEKTFQSINTEIVSTLVKLGLKEDTALTLHWSIQAMVTGWSAFDMSSNKCENTSNIPEAALTSLEVLIEGWSLKINQ